MTETKKPRNGTVSQRMVQFYFQHSPETRDLVEDFRLKRNMRFAEFNRLVYNAGLAALFEVEMLDNKPILPEQKAA